MSDFLKLKHVFLFFISLLALSALPTNLVAAPIRYQLNDRPMRTKAVKKTNNKLPLIYLDPGHGALDFGAVIKKPHVEEKKLCLLTAHYTKRCLEQLGYRVSLTRSRDIYVPLEKRASLANRFKAGLYISIHYNSCSNPAIDGIEIYYHDKPGARKTVSSKRLAGKVLTQMLAKTKARSRGVKRGNFLVIRETHMPAILVEAGFITNARERNKIRQRQYLLMLAKGIAEGINSFIKS